MVKRVPNKASRLNFCPLAAAHVASTILINGIGDFGCDLIENNMRRVCRDQAEVCTGLREFADLLEQVIGHASEVIRSHEIEPLLQINAIDDELRITTVALPLAIEHDDRPVIFDRAFRSEAANNSKNFH